MLPGKAFAMSLSSSVESSESSVIIVAAIEGTASSSSWFTLRNTRTRDAGETQSAPTSS